MCRGLVPAACGSSTSSQAVKGKAQHCEANQGRRWSVSESLRTEHTSSQLQGGGATSSSRFAGLASDFDDCRISGFASDAMACAMADNDDDDLLPTKGNCKPQPGHVAHAVGGAFGTEVVGDVEGGGIYRCTLQYAATLERAAQKLEDHLQKTLHGKGAGCPLGPACGIAVKRGKGRQEPGYIGYSTGDGLGRRKSCRAVRHVSGSIAIVYGRSRFFPTYTSQRPPSPATDAAPMPLHRRAQTSQQWLWARGVHRVRRQDSAGGGRGHHLVSAGGAPCNWWFS